MKGTFKGRFRQAMPGVMSLFACTGVVATAVLAVKATPKAMTLLKEGQETRRGEPLTVWEKVKTAGPCYLPAVGTGLGTIGLIFGSSFLSRRMNAQLAAGCGLMNQYYRRYQEKVREVVGPEKEREIRQEIAKDKYADCTFVDPDLLGVPSEGKALFYDPWGNRYFEALTEDVRNAEYHVNRDFAYRGAVGVNTFYEYLGIEPLEDLHDVGWAVDDEFYWIEFEHAYCELEGGLQCYILSARFDPVVGYEYGYWDAVLQQKELLEASQ